MKRLLKLFKLMPVIKTIVLLPLVLSGASCKNAYSETASKSTNDAYYFEAKQAIDAHDYTTALTKLLALSPSYQAQPDVTTTIASAFAGRCGLDMMTLANSLVNNTSARLFPMLIGTFKASTTGDIADCTNAETWMRKLAPANDFSKMTSDQAVYLALVSMSKIGAILSTYADLNADGTADGSFDSCDTTKFPDNYAREVGVSVNLVIAGLQASNSSLGSSMSGISGACSGFPAAGNFCTIFDASAFTVDQMRLINGLIKAQDIVGTGTCADTTVNCACH